MIVLRLSPLSILPNPVPLSASMKGRLRSPHKCARLLTVALLAEIRVFCYFLLCLSVDVNNFLRNLLFLTAHLSPHMTHLVTSPGLWVSLDSWSEFGEFYSNLCYAYECFACVLVCISPVYLVPAETRRGCRIPKNQSYRCLWAVL